MTVRSAQCARCTEGGAPSAFLLRDPFPGRGGYHAAQFKTCHVSSETMTRVGQRGATVLSGVPSFDIACAFL